MYLTSAFGLAFLATQAAPPFPDVTEFWKWVLQQGGMVTAVAMLLFFWRRDALRAQAREQEIANQRVEREKEIAAEARMHAQSLEGNNRILIDVVRENSLALGKATGVLDRILTK